MKIPAGFESGYPGREQDRWCVRREGAARTLCNLKVTTVLGSGYFPVRALMPTDRATGHAECLRVLDELMTPTVEVGAVGVCPVCGRSVELAEGRIGAHGGGCVGVNLKPRGAP